MCPTNNVLTQERKINCKRNVLPSSCVKVRETSGQAVALGRDSRAVR